MVSSLLDHRFVALVVFLGSFLPALLTKYRDTLVKKRLDDRERQIRELKRQAAPLNTPATFSKWAKMQREVSKLEKEVETLRASAQPKRIELILTRIPNALKMMFFVAMVFSIGYRTPFVQLPDSVVGPLARLVSSSRGVKGNVTGSMWIFACERSAGVVAHALVEGLRGVLWLVTPGPSSGNGATAATVTASAKAS